MSCQQFFQSNKDTNKKILNYSNALIMNCLMHSMHAQMKSFHIQPAWGRDHQNERLCRCPQGPVVCCRPLAGFWEGFCSRPRRVTWPWCLMLGIHCNVIPGKDSEKQEWKWWLKEYCLPLLADSNFQTFDIQCGFFTVARNSSWAPTTCGRVCW